jgi:hypothetical protein
MGGTLVASMHQWFGQQAWLQRGEAAEALAREFGTCHQFIMRILQVNALSNDKIEMAN